MQNNIFLTLFIGQSLVKLSEIDSTNSYLKKLLSNSKPLAEGTVIMADHQFAGRGQQNNSWESEAGKNLTISILLKPTFLTLTQQFYLNKAVSLGINDCLQQIIGSKCRIKWPNDIYYGDRKMGGVLIENIASGSHIKSSIIGIGINVNQKKFSDGARRACSLTKILHQDYDLHNLLSQLCKSIEGRYLQLKAGKLDRLAAEYINKLYRLDEEHFFSLDGEIVKGVITGVNKYGFLLLKIDEIVHELDLKQVQFIFED